MGIWELTKAMKYTVIGVVVALIFMSVLMYYGMTHNVPTENITLTTSAAQNLEPVFTP